MSKFDLILPPGLVSDDTRMAAKGRYTDGSNVRFWEGMPQIIGGWEGLTSTLLTGVCRNIFQWSDALGLLNYAFGTHKRLQILVGGGLYDVTPTLALPAATLGANPITTLTGTPTVVVAQKGHPHLIGETVTLSGIAAVGGITPNGAAVITATTADTWTFTFGANATSTATGGGSAVVAAPQRAFVDGQIDGTGGSGFGTGGFGVGNWGQPSTTDYFPRTWSLAAWGVNLVASPRGGAIHQWTNATGTPAAPILNSPARVRSMLVGPKDQLFALGCNQEASGVYNPLCIRHSSVRNITEWNTGSATTAREYVLPGGGEIVAGRVLGPYILVWTTHSLFVGTFVGALDQPWRFDPVAKNCGLVGPNAVAIVGQRAIWMSPDKEFRSYSLGGEPTIIPCPIKQDMVDNITASQADKIVASGNSKFGEVRFDYPDRRDGSENSRYIAVSLQDGNWYRGQMARTAMLDAGPSIDPVGATVDGNAYAHELGMSADGAPLPWFIETGEMYIDESITALIRGLWPDVSGQVGAWMLTIFSRLKPQGAARQFGPVAIAPTSEKVDIRFSGRLFRFRWSGNSLPAAGRLGRPVLDYTGSSQR